MRRLAFILNPRSGRQAGGLSKSDILRRLLAGDPTEYRIFETERAGHATELAAQAAASGYDVVVAYGGDGTLNEVASGLLGTRSALGIIPAGSGNGMARGLGIPRDPRKALDLIQHGRVRRLDVGEAGGSYFFNVFGLGFDACLAARFHREAGGVRGPLPYFTLGVSSFFAYRPPSVQITVEGEKLLIAPLVLTIANGPQYGVGARIAPEADFADGRLDLVWLERLSALRALRALPRLFNGTIDRVRGRWHRRFTELTLQLPSATEVQYDGEVRVGSERMDVRILPGALDVVC